METWNKVGCRLGSDHGRRLLKKPDTMVRGGGHYAPSNREDDLAIIVNNNNAVDCRADDTTPNYTTADYLEILPNYTVSNEGILERSKDVDARRCQTGGGAVSLTASTVNAGPNVDLLVEIYTGADVQWRPIILRSLWQLQ